MIPHWHKTLTERENYLRALEFRQPQWVPLQFYCHPALHERHGNDLRALMQRHPLVFGADPPSPAAEQPADPLLQAGVAFTDDWGCVWQNLQGGMLGIVTGHPLADWSRLPDLKVPDPLLQEDWAKLKADAISARFHGWPVIGGPTSFASGGFFDRLQFLRGTENLLVDLLEEPPQLGELIERVLEYNVQYLRRWLEIGIDVMYFHGDIATQAGLMLSPACFRRHFKPAYAELFRLCREAGVHVHYSSDGRILELVDDLVECGVSLHDPQTGANGLDEIRQTYSDRLCAMVDIDEQRLPYWTPREMAAHVRKIIATVGSPAGGLMLLACPTADVPLANLEAICTAWEEHGFFG